MCDFLNFYYSYLFFRNKLFLFKTDYNPLSVTKSVID